MKKRTKSDDLRIIDLDVEDLSALDETDDEIKNLGSLDKYICASYTWMHMLMVTVYTIGLIFGVTMVDPRFMWHLFMLAIVLFAIGLWSVYLIGLNSKKKKNKLNLHRIKSIWKICYMAGTFIYMCVLTMISGLLMAMYLTSNMLN